MATIDRQITVAVTGATGTLGRGLMPHLERDSRVHKIIAVGRRAFDPRTEGWRKADYRIVDVRDGTLLKRTFRGADVVVHLAFSLYGFRQRQRTLEQTNVDGSLNVLEAACHVGARRFVYASSGVVYGFDPKPGLLDESTPLNPSHRHFYSRQKAAVEVALRRELEHLPIESVFFRPCAVVGPDALGGALHGIPFLARRTLGVSLGAAVALGVPVAVPGAPVPLQFVHQDDAGQAFHKAITRSRVQGVYNLAGEGTVDGADVPRKLGLRSLPVPRPVTKAAIRALALTPPVVPGLAWAGLLRHPLLIDASHVRSKLGWAPRFDSGAALASMRRALGL